MASADTITVLGVGNPIMGDDGVGLALLRRLRDGERAVDEEWVPSVEAPDTDSAAESANGPATESVTESAAGPVARAGVEFIDGGTAGMELIDVVTSADNLLVVDAMAGPGAPGDVLTLVGDQIPRLLQSQLSPHQVGLLDLLACARLLGREPARVAAVGIVIESAELGLGLSPTVSAALPQAVAAANGVLDQWQAAEDSPPTST